MPPNRQRRRAAFAASANVGVASAWSISEQDYSGRGSGGDNAFLVPGTFPMHLLPLCIPTLLPPVVLQPCGLCLALWGEPSSWGQGKGGPRGSWVRAVVQRNGLSPARHLLLIMSSDLELANRRTFMFYVDQAKR